MGKTAKVITAVGLVVVSMMILFTVGYKIVNKEEKKEVTSSIPQVNVERDFDTSKEVEFEVKERSFGREGSFGRSPWRENYFSVLEKGREEQVGILVTKEMYERYQVGDTVKLYVDEKYKGSWYLYNGRAVEIID